MPRAGSVDVNRLNREDFEAHILVPHDDGSLSPTGQSTTLTTLNGKVCCRRLSTFSGNALKTHHVHLVPPLTFLSAQTVHVRGSVLVTGEGFKNHREVCAQAKLAQTSFSMSAVSDCRSVLTTSLQVPVLFEETFYNEHDESYSVICIQGPLQGRTFSWPSIISHLANFLSEATTPLSSSFRTEPLEEEAVAVLVSKHQCVGFLTSGLGVAKTHGRRLLFATRSFHLLSFLDRPLCAFSFAIMPFR